MSIAFFFFMKTGLAFCFSACGFCLNSSGPVTIGQLHLAKKKCPILFLLFPANAAFLIPPPSSFSLSTKDCSLSHSSSSYITQPITPDYHSHHAEHCDTPPHNPFPAPPTPCLSPHPHLYSPPPAVSPNHPYFPAPPSPPAQFLLHNPSPIVPL